METKVEVLEDNRTKVTATVDAEDVDNRIKKTYKDFAFKYNFPGFRKGKAPRPVVDNMLGKDAVRAQVTDDLVNGSYPLIIDERRLYPIGKAEFGETGLVVEHEPYEFEFTVPVKPEFELSSYEPVEIALPGEEATEQDIDEQIDTLREYYVTYEPADDDTPVTEGCTIDFDISATDDNGENIASLTTDDRQYTLGGNLYPAEFDDQLLGLKKGSKTTFTLDMPDDPPVMLAALADKTSKITFDVEVKQVKEKILPEVTDEWVKEKMGFDSLDAMREIVAESITQQKSAMIPRIKENSTLIAVAERLEGEAPEAMCEESETSLLQDFFQQLQSQNQTFDSYLAQRGITSEQFREDIKQQACDMANQDLALDAWARHFDFEATDEDIDAEFERSGAEDPVARRQEWLEAGQLYMVRQGIARAKAIQDLMDKAIVTEVDLSKPKEDSQDEADDDADTTDAVEKPASEEAKAEKKDAKKKASEKPEAEKKDTKKADTKKKDDKEPEAKKKAAKKKDAEEPAAEKPAAKKNTKEKAE